MWRRLALRRVIGWVIASCCASLTGGGCIPPAPVPNPVPTYANTTDPTNDNAIYLGSSVCRTCHADLSSYQSIHGHGHILNRVEGAPPVYPEEATRAGVPNPLPGLAWSEISYVIGGYLRRANFIDQDGYLLITSATGVPVQWNLSFPPTETSASFFGVAADAIERIPYDYSCFVCHTTGPKSFNEHTPQFQENRPGIPGTWEEFGVQCEACHGPGSNHISRPEARDNFVDLSASACGKCHSRDDANVITARDGFIQSYQQWPELLASGAHSAFRCINCHDPHRSSNYDRQNAFRVQCTGCHVTQDMAIHDGRVLTRGNYTELLSCTSCHMPFASKSAAMAGEEVVGHEGRVADLRTHIFRIDVSASDYRSMFTPDGIAVRKDASGRAAVTIDFVCLRCHNGVGSAFELSRDSAASIARGIHQIR